ncbi:hypothetical protein [Corallococcus sicarius]|uniref:hypothetical protein n=1 Tax=Corallococcus sicarius TaxID=2316726 RepID=UPI001FCA30E5|nr:hypothetical protein [Corallococcus sicarius]
MTAGAPLWSGGDNDQGQLGDGAVDTSWSPVQVQVPLNSSVSGIAVGEGHSLALLSDGSVWSWGDNSSGQLGHGIPAFAVVPERSLLLP